MAPIARATFTALAAALAFGTANAAVSPITRTGKFLYDATGARFFVKGLAYQRPGTIAAATEANNANGGFPEPEDYLDPLADAAACARDIPNFTALGINTVRVYSVNPYGDHAACMNALNDAGIYVIADISLPLNGSINRAAPSWDVGLLDQYIVSLTNLLPYSNLLAVNVGNEVVTSTANSDAAPYVKAAVRDIKAFLRAQNSNVLVGYASADGSTWRTELAAYLVCGSEATSIDIYGLNNYEWCGDSSYAASGYQRLTTEFADLPVVGIFSEFGCVSEARTWTEVPAIYSTPMTTVWSGGLAFEYFAGDLSYGLTEATASNDGPITTNAQFTALAAAYNAAIPPASTNAGVAASVYPACAPQDANFIGSSTLPPTPDANVCNCLVSSAFSCVVNPGITPVIVGTLLDFACSLLGESGGSCAEISGNGTTGVYGDFASCSAPEKLSYVATEYYESQAQNAQACSFAGNLSVNTNAPTSPAGVSSAIDSCIAQLPASGTFIPSLVASPTTGSTGTRTGTSGRASGTGTTGGNTGAGERSAVGWGTLVVAFVVGAVTLGA